MPAGRRVCPAAGTGRRDHLSRTPALASARFVVAAGRQLGRTAGWPTAPRKSLSPGLPATPRGLRGAGLARPRERNSPAPMMTKSSISKVPLILGRTDGGQRLDRSCDAWDARSRPSVSACGVRFLAQTSRWGRSLQVRSCWEAAWSSVLHRRGACRLEVRSTALILDPEVSMAVRNDRVWSGSWSWSVGPQGTGKSGFRRSSPGDRCSHTTPSLPPLTRTGGLPRREACRPRSSARACA